MKPMAMSVTELNQLNRAPPKIPKEPRAAEYIVPADSRAAYPSSVGVTYIMAVWSEGSVTTRTMAELLGVSTSTTGVMLRTLVDRGYLSSEVTGAVGYTQVTYTMAQG